MPFLCRKKRIEDAVEKAELLIFTTPTYCLSASAPMKNYIDLNYIKWMPHRPHPYMFHKKALVISTCAGAGAKSAVWFIKKSLFYQGVPYIKTFAAVSQAVSWSKVAKTRKEKITNRLLNWQPESLIRKRS